ncbi:MAG: hypothetical protein ACJAVM_001545 [Sulfitobacter sp.]|jgi:hypothetical protein
MAQHPHPFHAVAALAARQGMDDLTLKVERDGAYVRLFQNSPPLFFKHKLDPSDSFDRAEFDHFKRILLSEEDCSDGPAATLALIKMLLDKFADYESQRPSNNPKSGRKK